MPQLYHSLPHLKAALLHSLLSSLSLLSFGCVLLFCMCFFLKSSISSHICKAGARTGHKRVEGLRGFLRVRVWDRHCGILRESERIAGLAFGNEVGTLEALEDEGNLMEAQHCQIAFEGRRKRLTTEFRLGRRPSGLQYKRLTLASQLIPCAALLSFSPAVRPALDPHGT